MTLKQYFIKYKIKRKEFCTTVGIHYQHLNNILRGVRYPSRALAMRIEKATDGKIKAISLLLPKQSWVLLASGRGKITKN